MDTPTWRGEDDWPLPDTDYVDYFLDSGGHSNSAAGDGRLGTTAPDGGSEDIYLQAVNRVHRSSAHPSRLVLPVIQR